MKAMHESCGSRGTTRRLLSLTLAAVLAVGIAAPAAAQDIQRRWERTETPSDQMNVAEKVGTNVRRGFLGLADSLFNAAFSVVAIASPYGGHLVRKLALFVGDVVSLVDNNLVTERVFQGILSRQFLRLSAGAAKLPFSMGVIHDTQFDAPTVGLEDYIGPRRFNPRAYGENSALVTLGAVVISNLVVRPAGSVITIFGARERGDAMHEYGIDLIGRALKVQFL